MKTLTGRRRKSQQNGVTSEDADRQAQKKSAKQQIGKNADRRAQKKSAEQQIGKNADWQAQKSQQNSVTSENADLKIYMKREMRDNK